MANKKSWLKFVLTVVILTGVACTESNISQKIRVRGNEGDDNLRPKPKDWLNPLSMLAVSGLTELQELLYIVAGSTSNVPSCVKVSTNFVEWKCPATTVNPMGRIGIGVLRRTNNTIELLAEETELRSLLLMPNETRQAKTSIALSVRVMDDYKYVTLTESLLVVDKINVRHVYRWDITAHMASDGKLSEVTNRLRISRLEKRGNRWFERSDEYSLQSNNYITFGHCSRSVGEYNFSGTEQDPITFVTTNEKGPRVTSSSKAIPWPACIDQFYGLFLSRSFWLRPVPAK